MAFAKDPNIMYKLGITTMDDAEQRLSEETAKQRGFKKIALGRDYYVRTMWSIWVPTDIAERLEESFKTIRKNVWTTEDYNGITECRVFTLAEVNGLLAKLRKRFPQEKYWMKRNGYIHVYFDELTRKKRKIEYDDE